MFYLFLGLFIFYTFYKPVLAKVFAQLRCVVYSKSAEMQHRHMGQILILCNWIRRLMPPPFTSQYPLPRCQRLLPIIIENHDQNQNEKSNENEQQKDNECVWTD